LAVRLRLRRMGRKKRPFYRIVAADQRSPRDGRFIETLGFYDPLIDSKNLDLRRDRITYWLDRGAQPSETVKNLLRQQGILHRLDMEKRGLEAAVIEEEMKKWEALQIERTKRREAAAVQAKREKKKVEKEKKDAEVAASPAPSPATESKPAEPVTETGVIATEAEEPESAEAPVKAEEPEIQEPAPEKLKKDTKKKTEVTMTEAEEPETAEAPVKAEEPEIQEPAPEKAKKNTKKKTEVTDDMPVDEVKKSEAQDEDQAAATGDDEQEAESKSDK
jgi:small subunit ribosomal protein S16